MPVLRTRHRSLSVGLLLGWISAAASPSFGLVDPEGDQHAGQNDSMGSAVAIGVLSTTSAPALQVDGWIAATDPGDVDFFRFGVASASEEVYLDVDLADDPRQIVDLDEGADTALWLFDASGRLLATNDDSEAFASDIDNAGEDPGSDVMGDRDPLIGSITLPSGDYWVAVAWYGQAANAETQPGLAREALSMSGLAVSGASPDASFSLPDCTHPDFGCAGAYRLNVRTTYLPEPGVAAGVLAALGLVHLLRAQRVARAIAPSHAEPQKRPSAVPGSGRSVSVKTPLLTSKLASPPAALASTTGGGRVCRKAGSQ